MRIVRIVALACATAVIAACGSEPDADVGSPVASPTAESASTTTAAATATSTVAPTSTAPPVATTAAPSTTEPARNCRRLDDFDLDAGAWAIVNDGVMGGRSDGRGTIDDSILSFFGNVVTAGGGFTSVRLRLDGTELDGTDRIRARLRLDDRAYGFTFEDDQAIQGRRISHGADVVATDGVDGEGFTIVELPYNELRPSVFGQDVSAEPFRPDEAREIGIIISDGVDGEFAIDVDWIDVCAATTAR